MTSNPQPPFEYDHNIRRYHWAGYVIPAVLILSSVAGAVKYPSWLWLPPVACSLGTMFATFRIRTRTSYGQILIYAAVALVLVIVAIVAVNFAMKGAVPR